MSHNRLRSLTHILLIALLITGALPSLASAAPEATAVASGFEQAVSVRVTQPSPSIAPDGTMRLDVAVTTAAAAEYLEVRIRLRSPSGKLIYQKTEVRSDVPAGTHTISYERDLADLDLAQGRYPVEVRVLASGAQATNVSSRLLIVDPQTDTLPVAVVVVPVDTPWVTMEGTLSGDPTTDTRLRDDLAFLTQLTRDRKAPLSIALAPVLTEQLARVAGGFETTAGVEAAITDETPLRYARMLEALRSAVATGTIELLDVPYGLPDNTALASLGAASDIGYHWTYTDTVNALVFPSEKRSRVAYLGTGLTDEALASAAERGAGYVLAHGDSLRAEDSTATPGCYTLGDSPATVVVVDERAAAGLSEGPDAFYDALFDRLGAGPVVVMLETGASHTAFDVQHALDWIDDASWLRATDVAEAVRGCEARPARLVRGNGDTVSTEYWAAVSESRAMTLAFADAAGLQDPEAAAATRAVLAAESSLITRPAADDRARAEGLARAAEAYEYTTRQFGLIRLDAKDVTLSGSKGDVPLTLINDTGKQLKLTLSATSATMLSTVGSQEVAAQPTQNFLTLPVDLGNALSDELKVVVRAGGVTVAEATVGVKASYVDRLATVAMVVVVLAVLLVIIRRRVQSADAATIQQDDERPPRAT